jgi:hypothetical protein
VLRVEGKYALQTLQQICEKKTEYAERKDGCRVAYPRLLDVGMNSAKPINQPFNRPKNRVKKRPLALEYAKHENANRLGDGDDEPEEN